MNSAAADAPSAPCAWTRRTWLGAAGATAVLGSAGCGRAQDNAVRFWAMGREGEVVTELLQGFYQEQPDVQVRVDQLPWSAAHEKLLTAFAGDATPDLAQLGNTWLPELVALGALEPLDALAKGPQGVDQSDYFAGIWDTNVVAGQLYGLPWYVDTRVLFYRRDLLSQAGFETPPRTWAEWLQMQHAIKRVVGPDKYAVLLPLNEYDPLVALSLQQGEPLLREGGRYGNFRSADFGRTLDFYLSMYKQKLAPPASSNEVANVWNEFARGYFSFYITGPWNIGEFKRRQGACVPVPAGAHRVQSHARLPAPRRTLRPPRPAPAKPASARRRAAFARAKAQTRPPVTRAPAASFICPTDSSRSRLKVSKADVSSMRSFTPAPPGPCARPDPAASMKARWGACRRVPTSAPSTHWCSDRRRTPPGWPGSAGADS